MPSFPSSTDKLDTMGDVTGGEEEIPPDTTCSAACARSCARAQTQRVNNSDEERRGGEGEGKPFLPSLSLCDSSAVLHLLGISFAVLFPADHGTDSGGARREREASQNFGNLRAERAEDNIEEEGGRPISRTAAIKRL